MTWRQELKERYPVWLRSISDIEVRDGWQALVTEFIDEICRTLGGEPGAAHLRILALRAKLGRLAVVLDGLDADDKTKIERVVLKAQERSLATCEWCGAPGEFRPLDSLAGWTGCEDHRPVPEKNAANG